ncbi:hypothetical protein ABNC86_20680 [Paenibacillus larvae]
MENLEIILVDFRKEKLDQLLFEELQINIAKVKASHFYDKKTEKDIEFHKVKSVKSLLSPVGTGNILLSQLKLGCTIKEILIVFSFDEENGDIVFNFPESAIFTGEKTKMKSNCKKLLKYFVGLKHKFDISKVKIGYEPATDDDTCLIELNDEIFDIDVGTDKMLIKSQMS